jgi:hypothetical protein
LNKIHSTPPVLKAENAPPVFSAPNDPTKSLQAFQLSELAQFTREKSYSSNASSDFHLFFVGRDNVHEILKYVLSRTQVSLYLNMFGYDDSELNDIVMQKVLDPHITVLICRLRHPFHNRPVPHAPNQSHERVCRRWQGRRRRFDQLVHLWQGQFVAGTYYVKDQIAGAGYKAQNNTQTIITDPDSVIRFQAELIAEHLAARDEEVAAGIPASERQRRPKIDELPAIRAARSGRRRPSASAWPVT